ncbi:OprD family outer membrane porin [Trinickia caryophylli]|uniref:Outer membrane porin, OprD family n=1 Tax=Trinickia caryophylli TaxID=28094 RepID=A0A1X7G2Y4_TRICW|nr:OprD family outer membrane porin [Trinickia caryophylli]PMS13920.1 outer membrane porin, OprD family [Trinickia caryophylli]TRX14217.1 OprD family porin [Trinickia caryophylli]WQE14043.1 OprD family outer membrane porin [Trinickia caryophylli]SMF63040.1 outer membrane porin, OprD family [Trinickia caryophylli]GLU33468.1 porin [Trinickia caryophylli]
MERDKSLTVRAATFIACAGLSCVCVTAGAEQAAETVANVDVIEAAPADLAVQSSQARSRGLFADGHFGIELRSYTDYLHNAGTRARRAWVGSTQARYESGFSTGLIGSGFDAALFGALKFDGGMGAGNMVHVDKNGGGANRLAWGYPGTYDVKARISETVAKFGLHAVSNPFLEPHDNRALPPTFLGVSLASREWRNVTLQAGSFTKVNARGHTSLSSLSTSYGGVNFDRLSYLGGVWDYSSNGSAALFADEAEDVWRQYYASVQQSIGRTESVKLTGFANLYATRDTGTARQGPIDTKTFSVALTAQHGPHALLLGYQRVLGDEFFDYVNETAGDYLANSMDVDYNAPHEQSLQLRYMFDGKYANLPGFSAMLWAQQGWGADGSAVARDPGRAGTAAGTLYLRNGQPVHGRHHEFGVVQSYMVQGGRFKHLKFQLSAMWHVGSTYYPDPTGQVYRLVMTLPISVF